MSRELVYEHINSINSYESINLGMILNSISYSELNNLELEFEFDYSDCCYPYDTPSIILKVYERTDE